MAASMSVPMAPHSFHDLHIHLIASASNGLFVEFFRDDAILPFRNILDQQLEMRDGRLVLPIKPGLGFEFNQAALDKFAVNAWE
jgi:L-alanine-DL-glutamate epimerase-like enolase superfamily enzyme